MTGLRELLAAATPRPWTCHPPEGRFIRFGGEAAMEQSGYVENEPDAALIVSLVNTADELLAVAEAARLIQAFDQSGGNDWWEAHAKLYAALAALDAKTGAA